jgi:hypothetical protein
MSQQAVEPTLEQLAIDKLTLNIVQEIHVQAPVDVAFETLLEQLGPANETPEGQAMPLVLEAFPGGRWYRDLGQGNGHFWAHLQAIKKDELLEMFGPLFMSGAVVSNVQYRLKAMDGGTLITLRHTAFGMVPEPYRSRIGTGWVKLMDRVRRHAEGSAKGHSA